MRGGLRRALAAGLAAGLAACHSPPHPSGSAAEPVAHAAAPDPRASRLALEQARGLLREQRADAAERVLRDALADDPGDAALHRALARTLENQGRSDLAAAEWTRADALEPPPAPLPDTPLPGLGAGLLVAIVAAEDESPASLPAWPEPEVESVLADRLAVRLPRAHVLRADPGSVGAARQWLAAQQAHAALSIAVARSWCGFTIKDGQLAVAVLRVAAAGTAGRSDPRNVKAALETRSPRQCRLKAVGRALEAALADDAVRAALADAGAPPAWSREALRALFPSIGRRLHEQLRSARSLLAAGELGEAQRAFAEAAEIDPDDPDARAYLADTALTLELARQLAARGDVAGAPERLSPRFSDEGRAAAESALEDERRRRDQLLAALSVLDEDLTPPPPERIASLHAAPLAAADGLGVRLARARTQGEIGVRVAYAPDGSELARYYVTADDTPLVREEDTDGDGAPDRWIAYQGGARSDIYESRRGSDGDLHFAFAAGGEVLLRVEVDPDRDGRPDHVFRYANGRLDAEDQDTDGDGKLDRFDRFDADGRVALREEDLDGDGAIDVRSRYQAGRLMQRELSDPSLLPRS